MTDSQDPVRLFQSAVNEAFEFEPSSETVAQFRRALAQVGRQNEHDLVAAVVLSCFEARQAAAGNRLTDDDVRRAVWRVEKAIIRQAARAARVDPHRVHSPPPTPGPDEVASKREELGKVMRVIAELSVADQVLIMRWLEGASAIEIGDDLDMSPSAVRQHVHRTLLKIREALQK